MLRIVLIDLGIWIGVTVGAIYLSRLLPQRLRPLRKAVFLAAFPLPLLLLMPGELYFMGRCVVESGVRVSHPIPGIVGWVLDPQTDAGCNGLCHDLLWFGRYRFVEVEVRSGQASGGTAQSRYFLFTLGKSGAPACVDTLAYDGTCVVRKETDALLTPYRYTRTAAGSRTFGIGGSIDRVVDLGTGEILASMEMLYRESPSVLELLLHLPQSCPGSRDPVSLMLQSFPPPK